MLEYDKIDVSEGLDVNKTNDSRECFIYHYQHFLKINFGFEPKVCDSCHDLMQKAILTGVFFKENDCRVHFLYMSKDEAMNLLRNVDLTEKSGTL